MFETNLLNVRMSHGLSSFKKKFNCMRCLLIENSDRIDSNVEGNECISYFTREYSGKNV